MIDAFDAEIASPCATTTLSSEWMADLSQFAMPAWTVAIV